MRNKKTISVGDIKIGGFFPVVVQTMTKTDTRDVQATLKQIEELAILGCEMIRCAVPDETAARALAQIVDESPIPVIADIHFHHKLALTALESGVHGLRLNPGNIGADWKVKEIAVAAKERNVPIRVGANSGSLPKDLLAKYNGPTPEALVSAALREVDLLESYNFDQIKISVKATEVETTIKAYELLDEKTNYPIHLGLTEAGPMLTGAIKSTAALVPLLKKEIGDTLRVSLSADPTLEVISAYEILAVSGVRQRVGADIISCPTCGRKTLDVVTLAKKVQESLYNCAKPIKVAVMGCPVNGPGEAKQADIGIAGGGGKGIIFRKGEIVKTCKEEELLYELMKEVDKISG